MGDLTAFLKAWAKAEADAWANLKRDNEIRARGLYLQMTQGPVLGLGAFIPIVADPRMPPGYFEMRSGAQVIGAWLPEARDGHDPGDEDRSAR